MHLQPLPAPEDGPPSQVLASVLEQTPIEWRQRGATRSGAASKLRSAELVTVNR